MLTILTQANTNAYCNATCLNKRIKYKPALDNRGPAIVKIVKIREYPCMLRVPTPSQPAASLPPAPKFGYLVFWSSIWLKFEIKSF